MPEREHQRRAFHLYVELGAERSYEALAQRLQADPSLIGLRRPPSPRQIERWGAQHHWQDRLADREREARRQDALAEVAALREMNTRHAREGMALQQRALRRLQALANDEMSPALAVRALAEGIRLERLGRGEVTDRTETERPDDDPLAGFSLAELRGLAALAQAELESDLRPGARPAGL